MLKSQRHYYWIGGALWGSLMLGGVLYMLLGAGGSGLGEMFSHEAYEGGEIVAGDDALREKRRVVRREVGMVDIAAAGLQMTDPVVEADSAALDLDVPEGRYRVEAFYPANDPRVLGIVAVWVGEGEVAAWESVTRKGSPLDLDFGIDAIFAVGDAETIAALDAAEVEAALAASDARVPEAQITAEGREVMLFDPSFEALSSAIFVGFAEDGTLLVVAKDFGYFATAKALEERAEEAATE